MTHEELLKIFVYEPETGMLRKVSKCRKPYPWHPTGTDRAYLGTRVNGKTYRLHSLVWFFHNGRMPSEVDHINGDRRDNRIENLRECSHSQNCFNRKTPKHNKTGIKGVSFIRHRITKPWKSTISVEKQRIHLGYFKTIDEASAAYAEAANKYAGKFARL